jgi:hypothetical protein
MKTIPEVYRKNGYDYKLISRSDNVAIYEQTDNGKFIGYEVCRIKIALAGLVFGKWQDVREILPSSSEWGRNAYTVFTIEKAHIRASELEYKSLDINEQN